MKIGRPISAAIATHSGLDTGIHGVGADYVPRIGNAGRYALDRSGDTNMGGIFKQNVDDGMLEFESGYPLGACVAMFGRNNPSFPGQMRVYVPNAAKDAYIVAMRFSGCTDTPEMLIGVIPQGRLKKGSGNASVVLPTGVGTITGEFTVNQYSFIPRLMVVGGTMPGGTLYHDTSAALPAAAYSITAFLQHTIDGGESTLFAWWDYLSASGPPEIWIGLDKDDRPIVLWSAGDPPPVRPPINSDDIVRFVRVNPEPDDYKAMLPFGLADIYYEPGRLVIAGQVFCKVALPKQVVLCERMVREIVIRQVPIKVPQKKRVYELDEWTGLYVGRDEVVRELITKDHYCCDVYGRVTKGQVTVEEPVMVDGFDEVEEELTTWEPVS